LVKMMVFRTETSPMALLAFLWMCQVSAYDIDDSVLHKITFSPHGVHTNQDKVTDPYTLTGGDLSTVYLDKDGNKVPKAIVEEILAAHKELESLEESKEKEENEKAKVENDVSDETDEEESIETVTMTTRHNEKYVCTLPKMTERQKLNMDNKYSGQTPLDLLEPLLTQHTCTHRLDHYWTYELCHGKTLRQYHEEREGSKVKKTEYLLGIYSKEMFVAERDSARKAVDEAAAAGIGLKKPRKKRVESMNMPYFEVIMKDGTLCDLNGLPRKTRVHYVCYPSGHNEIFSLEETSTCEYEVLVLTPLLCKHPDYRAESAQEKEIKCVPMNPPSSAAGTTSEKPADLQALEKANDEYREKFANAFEGTFTSDGKGTVKISFKQVKPSGSPPVQGTANVDEEDEPDTSPAVNLPKKTTAQPKKPERPPFKPLTDPIVVQEFLMGKHCLYGGSGWWKYEFCYGKKVDQYHEENGKRATVINLGVFNQEKHIEWIKANPSKAPRKNIDMRKQVSHLYSDGDWCELADKKRTVEVKLKCKKSDSPSAVGLYLLEPKTCEYILGVESPLICDILPQANEYGLMDMVSSEEHSTLNDDGSGSGQEDSEEVLQLRKALGLNDDNASEDEEELAQLLEHAKRAAEIAKQSAADSKEHHDDHLKQHEEHLRKHHLRQHKAQHKEHTDKNWKQRGVKLEDLAVDYDTLLEDYSDHDYSLNEDELRKDVRLVDKMVVDDKSDEDLVNLHKGTKDSSFKETKQSGSSTKSGQSPKNGKHSNLP